MKNIDPVSKETVSNRIHARCFVVLTIVVFADVMLKINLWNIIPEWGQAILTFAILPLSLVVILYVDLFWHAKEGMLLGVKEGDLCHFPKKQCAKRAAAIGGIVAVCIWTLRVMVGASTEAWAVSLAVMLILLYAISFAILFGVLYLSWYLAYLVVRKYDGCRNI